MEVRSVAERFWTRVEFTESCWLWLGGKDAGGYGHFTDKRHGKPMILAHRWAYEFCIGPIPDGLVIDHLCRTRSCVLPEHLEPVTQKVNLWRGDSPNRETCRNGHALAGENERIWRDKRRSITRRMCRECLRTSQRARRATADIQGSETSA